MRRHGSRPKSSATAPRRSARSRSACSTAASRFTDLKSSQAGGDVRRPLAGLGAGLAAGGTAARAARRCRASAGAIRCRPTASNCSDLRMADPDAGGCWKMDSLLIEGLDLARFDAGDDRPVPARRCLWRGPWVRCRCAAWSSATLVFAMPGSGDTFGMATVVVGALRARPHRRRSTIGGIEATAHARARRRCSGSPTSRSAASTCAAASRPCRRHDWRPGAPIGAGHGRTRPAPRASAARR